MSDYDDSPWAVAPSQSGGPKFRVAICGGGIGGLCLAVALSKFPDIEISLYEAAQSFKEVGAGVMIWGRTWRVLTLLGLDKTLREVAGVAIDGSEDPPFGFDFRRGDQKDGCHRICLLNMPWVGHLYHRAHFLDVFVDRLPKEVAHLGKRLVSYTQANPTDEISLTFADGSAAICDVLIGADGIKSVVRRRMFEDLAREGQPKLLKYIEPFWTGTVAYRTLLPAKCLPPNHRALNEPLMYCGRDKHIVCYPVSKGKLVNFVGFSSRPAAEGTVWNGPWVSEASTEDVRDCYRDFETEAQQLIENVQKPLRWAIHQLTPLPTYNNGCAALLGDAAHAMPPHQGAGAGQSIEDAYILAGLLGHHSATLKNLAQVLKAYDHVRRPFANNIIGASRNAGALYELRSQHGDDYSTLAPAIYDQWDWVESEDPEAQLERALNWMQRQAGARASL